MGKSTRAKALRKTLESKTKDWLDALAEDLGVAPAAGKNKLIEALLKRDPAEVEARLEHVQVKPQASSRNKGGGKPPGMGWLIAVAAAVLLILLAQFGGSEKDEPVPQERVAQQESDGTEAERNFGVLLTRLQDNALAEDVLKRLQVKNEELQLDLDLRREASVAVTSHQEAREMGTRLGARLVVWQDADGPTYTLTRGVPNKILPMSGKGIEHFTSIPQKTGGSLPEDGLAMSRLLLGLRAFSLRGYEAAALYFEELPQGDADTAFYLGSTYMMLGRFEDATARFDEALALRADHTHALYQRGMVQFYMGNLDEAYNNINRVTELDPKNATAFAARATAYRSLGDIASALADLETSARLAPDDATPYLQLGSLHQGMGDLSEAVKYYTKSIQTEPDFSIAYFFRGQCYGREGKWTLCRQDMERFIDLAVQSSAGDRFSFLGQSKTDTGTRYALNKGGFEDVIQLAKAILYKLEEEKKVTN